MALATTTSTRSAAIEAMDLPEFRRLYGRTLAADDDLAVFYAQMVSQCEELMLSVPATASAWREAAAQRASLESSHEGLRATCRDFHTELGTEVEDC